MRFSHDGGTIDLKIGFENAPVLKRSKVGTWILLAIPVVLSKFYFLALNNAIMAFPSKRISPMLDFSTDDECTRILPELEGCGNAKRSDSNDVLREGLLVAQLTVLTASVFSPLTVCWPLPHFEVACSACWLVARALFAVLNSVRLADSMKPFSTWVQVLYAAYSLDGDSLMKVIPYKRAECLTM